MTLLQLKRLYSLGMLVGARVIKAPDTGWILEMESDSGSIFSMSKTKGNRDTRIFTTVDAACSSAAEIGFTDVVVKLPEKNKSVEEFTLT